MHPYKNSGKKKYWVRLTLISCLLFNTSLTATTLLLPVEAIVDSGFLTHTEFKETYPGIDISGQFPDDEGWFVRYHHKNLTYYFGPIDTRAEAIPYKEELERVFAKVLEKRDSLKTATIELYHNDFDRLDESQSNSSASDQSQEATAQNQDRSSQENKSENDKQTASNDQASKSQKQEESTATSEKESKYGTSGQKEKKTSIFDLIRKVFGW